MIGIACDVYLSIRSDDGTRSEEALVFFPLPHSCRGNSIKVRAGDKNGPVLADGGRFSGSRVEVERPLLHSALGKAIQKTEIPSANIDCPVRRDNGRGHP